MAALVEDLTIEQGITWSTGWAVQAGLSLEELAPIDATWTAKAQIRVTQNRSSALLYEFEDATVDAEGNVVIGVPFADSEAWTFADGYYDVEVTNADETIRLRVAMGRVLVSNEVTTE